MYQTFFGLSKRPFHMTADPEFLYMTSQHREALAAITYAMLDRKGLAVLTGDAGLGKTTLLVRVLQYLASSRIRSSVILHPTLTSNEFLEMILLAFDIREIPASKTLRLAALHQFLLDSDQEGRICTLAVDEAHKLSPELFEEIRLLGNQEHCGRKLLQILLLGQTELADLLNRPDFRQVKQRIAVRFNLERLPDSQVEEYIRHRWQKAGGGEFPFLAETMPSITQHARGIPRVINAICDNALLLAFSDNSKLVRLHHLQEACKDLHLAETAEYADTRLPVPAITTPLSLDRSELPGLPTLERTAAPAARRSVFTRWVGKLKLA
jgi:general secretion pathway protein A